LGWRQALAFLPRRRGNDTAKIVVLGGKADVFWAEKKPLPAFHPLGGIHAFAGALASSF